jgi:transposase-like protein
VIRLTVMLYIRSPLSLRQVEDLLFEPGIDICHETVRALVVPIRPDVRRGDPEGDRWLGGDLCGQTSMTILRATPT